jgi:hypothetical protein
MKSEDEKSLAKSEDEKSLVKSLDEKSLVKSLDEKSLVKSLDEKSLVKSEDEWSLPEQLGMKAASMFFVVGDYLHPLSIDDLAKGKPTHSYQQALLLFLLWLPMWVKISLSLFIICSLFFIVFGLIIEAKAKNKLTVWWLFFRAPEGLFCFLVIRLFSEYVLNYWYLY